MLFWIFVITLVLFILLLSIDIHFDWNDDALIPIIFVVVNSITVLTMLIFIIIANSGIDGQKASLQKEYESLTYQYQNNIYENDNDIGKSELMNEIKEWNSNLARNKENQRNLWIGIFTPDIYDEINFIELEKENKNE